MREYKLTALMAATSFLMVSGLMTNNRQMYWMASVLGFVLLVSYLLVKRRLRVERFVWHAPEEVQEGETFSLVLEVGAFVGWGVVVSDAEVQLPHSFLMERCMLETQAGLGQVVHCEVVAQRRGQYTLGYAWITVSDMFGLFSRRVYFEIPTEVVVLPRPKPLPNWQWEGGGRGRYLMSSAIRGQRGEGTDWHGTRPYVPGDPLRRINWRATARHNEWYVQEFETNQLAPVLVILEQSPCWHTDDIGSPDFDQAVRYLAWLAGESARQGVTLRVVDRNGVLLPFDMADPRMVRQFLRWLALLKPDATQSVLDMLPALVRQYSDPYCLVIMVPVSEQAMYESAVVEYRQQGYGVEVIGVST